MKEKLLKIISDDVENCTKCNLCITRNKTVFGSGNVNSSIVFVGEAPGRNEDAEGKPFVGRAGKLLTKIIESIGYNREDVYILNTVKCWPPDNRKPADVEKQACKYYFDLQLTILNPKIIVALGATATESLTGIKSLKDARGQLLKYNGFDVIATYHPAALLRNPDLKIECAKDLSKVKQLSQNK